ncbi:nucleotide sugar dehydrogenase [Aliamphritea spongicola]|uniref:nucleotide sugar dehydrogenase n=1 Tax=Aliamphritea spongicola TaxID=707589 RepID=UPI00196A31A1|nr:nucleotide sugar dehydrogenase [Aliamphritea spongicola]MBN3563450.1 UDP-glucose/GDP-mannose dehydrogenase family protein [Aliamphritea spongicola]
MKITVYGKELTSWVAAACLARSGNEVTIIENPSNANIRPQPLPAIRVLVNEPGLLDLVEEQIHSGRLVRNLQSETDTTIHWLALNADEISLAKEIVSEETLESGTQRLIVNQSNFGVGATEQLQNLLTHTEQHDVIYLPDLIQEGNAINDFSTPKRLIIGADREWSIIQTNALLRPFSQSADNIQVMAPKEAEFTKFAITGMLAIRIGYINELANLADQINVDIDVIRQGMGADPRIGHHYMSPGCGFGGQNFQEYTRKFSELFEQKSNPSLLATVIKENEVQKELLFRKLWQHYQCDLKGKTVSLWGGSFKPETASIDNAPSLKIIEALLAQQVTVKLHDPQALQNLQEYFGNDHSLEYCDNRYTALENSDALLIVTEWQEYWSPDYSLMLSKMRTPLIIDGRNIFDKEMLQSQGFTYTGIGR